MINIQKDYLCDLIRMDCINIIMAKNVDVEDLAFDLGISEEEFVNAFVKKCNDFTLYLRAYNLLLER